MPYVLFQEQPEKIFFHYICSINIHIFIDLYWIIMYRMMFLYSKAVTPTVLYKKITEKGYFREYIVYNDVDKWARMSTSSR